MSSRRSPPSRPSTGATPPRPGRCRTTSASSRSCASASRSRSPGCSRSADEAGVPGTRAVLRRDARGARAGRRRLRRGRRRAHQGDRGDDQPRREGGRVLAARALRRQRRGHAPRPSSSTSPAPRRTSTTSRTRAWCGAARDEVLLPAIDAHRRRSWTQLAHAARRRRDARAHPRAAGHADDARQGDGQRRASAAPRARATSSRSKLLGKIERRDRQLQRARGRRTRASTGRASRGASSNRSGVDLQPAHDPDRAARRARRGVRCDRAPEHHPRRPRSRRLGLHLARLLQAEAEGGRSGLLDHAAQGEPDRLRELRRQPRARQRAAAAPRRRSFRSRAGSATSPIPRCCATWAWRSATPARVRLRALAASTSSRPNRARHRRGPRRRLGRARRGGADGDAPRTASRTPTRS